MVVFYVMKNKEENIDFVKSHSNLIDFAFQMDCDRTEWCQWIFDDAIMDLRIIQ